MLTTDHHELVILSLDCLIRFYYSILTVTGHEFNFRSIRDIRRLQNIRLQPNFYATGTVQLSLRKIYLYIAPSRSDQWYLWGKSRSKSVRVLWWAIGVIIPFLTRRRAKWTRSQVEWTRHQAEMTLRRNMLLYFNVKFDASPSWDDESRIL